MNEVPLLTSIDGVVTASGEALLPMPDDGLLRGDGVFEVLRSYEGTLFALGDHLERLGRSAAAIGLEIQRDPLEAETAALLAGRMASTAW